MFTVGYMASLFMGLSLGLIGGGGAILTVPILVYFFSVDPVMATSESLFIVGCTALVGGVISASKKEVCLSTVVKFALASFLGVYVMKNTVLTLVPEVIIKTEIFVLTKSLMIMAIFAALMLIVSLVMIIAKKSVSQNTTQQNRNLKISAQGFFVGNITGLVGAGGGFLIVPALVNFVGLSMRQAIGSSLLIIAANSLFGFSVSLSAGLKPDWSVLMTVLSISVVGLLIGRVLSKKVPEAQLKRGFGFFVLLMGSVILLDQISNIFYLF